MDRLWRDWFIRKTIFKGVIGFNKVKFELMANGDVKIKNTMWDSWSEDKRFLELHEGIKVLKYGKQLCPLFLKI